MLENGCAGDSAAESVDFATFHVQYPAPPEAAPALFWFRYPYLSGRLSTAAKTKGRKGAIDNPAEMQDLARGAASLAPARA
jgi:hypothetical protein